VRPNSVTRTGIAGVGANHFSTTNRKDFPPAIISCSFNLFHIVPLRLFRPPLCGFGLKACVAESGRCARFVPIDQVANLWIDRSAPAVPGEDAVVAATAGRQTVFARGVKTRTEIVR
jgi:hypothetical protein